ncbi:MAG: glycosyltransferase involved in cell wall biosynthesis [bacterium]|jgi:glycosyltransferase involved in cell wall biosynthesis
MLMGITTKVGIDLKTYSLLSAGIGRYSINLIQNLLQNKNFNYHGFASPLTDFSLLPKNQIKLVQGVHNFTQSSLLRGKIILPLQASLSKVELFHTLDNNVISRLPNRPYKTVSTIHDLVIFKYPELFTKKHATLVQHMITHAVKNADHIITVSESTKSDLLQKFPKLKNDRVSVTPLAASEHFTQSSSQSIENIHSKYQLSKTYFLSLGTFEPRKNLKRLIEAFRELKKKPSFEHVGLVLVGGSGWLDSGIGSNKEELAQEKIYPLGRVDDLDLPPLYSGALSFVYPSIYEGFGLPVLEAMSCGTPVITSQTSSLPEVAGKVGTYVDPLSINSIKDAMISMLENEESRIELSQKVLEKSKEFSWKKTANLTEVVYKQLLG